jgi:hypothetical protein
VQVSPGGIASAQAFGTVNVVRSAHGGRIHTGGGRIEPATTRRGAVILAGAPGPGAYLGG